MDDDVINSSVGGVGSVTVEPLIDAGLEEEPDWVPVEDAETEVMLDRSEEHMPPERGSGDELSSFPSRFLPPSACDLAGPSLALGARSI